MATIVQLKHIKTGELLSLFSIDAREFLDGPEGPNWVFERKLERGSKLVENGVRVVGQKGGAVEFSGEVAEKEATERSLAEPPASSKGGAKRGQRGGGPQDPVNAPAE